MKRTNSKANTDILTMFSFILLVLSGVSVSATNSSSDGAVLDYCEGQTFSARCPSSDDVVLMQSAFYGRMRSGRCLKVAIGTECQFNIRDQFDVWCSGQRSCEVRISSIIDSLPENALPCLRDYRGYLEASYTCVKAVLKRKEECAQRNSGAEVFISGSGYLASIVTEETSCGSTDVPWVLRASPGQQIRLRLYDFAITNRERDQLADQLPRVCQVYAVIKEKPSRGSETICGSEDRESHKYTSVTHQLELRMVAASASSSKKKSYYMFQYEVIGCPDLSPSSGQWIARQDVVSTLVCNMTGEKWQMKCEGGEWIGPKKNCTVHDGGDSDPANAGLIWAIFTGSQWAAIAIILGIAITIGLIIFLVGLVYLKKRRPVSLHGGHSGCASPHCVPSYHLAHCSDPILPTPGSKSLQSTRSTDAANYSSAENDYFRTWQLQRQVVPPPACSAAAGAAPSATGQRFTVLRACPAGQFAGGGSCGAEPSGQCGGRRVVIEHIYESPKFERRDLSSPEGADTPGQQPGTPLQYHELDPRVVRS